MALNLLIVKLDNLFIRYFSRWLLRGLVDFSVNHIPNLKEHSFLLAYFLKLFFQFFH
jgi:hypothetical protein